MNKLYSVPASLVLALASAGCTGPVETTGAPSCGPADVDGLSVAPSDPLGGSPYALGYPPYSVDGCLLAYVGEAAAGEGFGALRLRDLATGDDVVVAPAAERPRRPSLAGDVLAWEADVDGRAVVRVRAQGATVTLEGSFHHAGEPRASEDGVVLTAFLEEGDSGDTDIHVASPGESATEPFFVGPGQQRFADISATHVAFSDFAEDPDGTFDDDSADLADVVVKSRDGGAESVRSRAGKQAFPTLGADGKVAYLEWGLDHPEPKLSAYTLVLGSLAGATEGDAVVAEIRTLMPYIRPTARGDRLRWVHWPEGESPALWTQPVDLSIPAEQVTGIEGPALLSPSGSSSFTLAIVLSGASATLRATGH